ncbi:MAG: hypothetical protein ACI9NY_001545 [Kiritimatiellia bacterium]|jgi:hypothetical protein
MNDEAVPISESVSNFNLYSVELRAKIDTILKHVLFVSGGIQTITIGAFLNGKIPALTEAVVSLLKCGWLLLSISIICCLSLMLLQILGMVHVGLKQADKLSNLKPGVEVMNTWLPLRMLNWAVGLTAFFTCVFGVYIISKAAITLINGGSVA